MRRGPLLAVAALTALGGGLRFGTLAVQSWWYDEAVTVGLLRRGFGGMLAAVPHSESTPPLYYALGWVWARLFGTSEVGLRSFSALAGTALIPVAWAVVRRLGGERAGIATAALVATSPLLIWYSQEARAYSLLALLCALSLLATVAAAEGAGGWRWPAAWGVIAALALATHYFAFFPVAAEAAYLVWRARERPAVRAALAGVVAAGLALTPLLVEQAGAKRAAFISETPLGHRVVQLGKQLLVGYHAPAQALLTAAAILAALIALAGLRRADARQRRAAALLALVSVACLVVPIVLALVGPDYVIARNLLAGAVPALGLIALGAGAHRWAVPGSVAIAVLVTTGLIAFVAVELTPTDQRSNWRGAARALPASHGRRLVVADTKGALVLRLYLRAARRAPAGVLGVEEIDLVATSSRAATALNPDLSTPPIPGFVVAARRFTPSYQVVVWRRAPGQRMPAYTGALLTNLAPDKARASLLVQPPGR